MRSKRLALLAPLALAGCITFSLAPPSPSHLQLDLPANPPAMAISLVDERPTDGRIFVVWDSFAKFPEEGEPKTDPPQFLAANTQAEMVSRGLPVTITVGDQGLPRIHLRSFRLRGYSEKLWVYREGVVARVLISADLETASGRKRIGVFTAGLDQPLATFSNESPVAEALDQPLGMAVKEFAAKLADQLYDYRSSDATVEEIAALIGPPLYAGSYRNVYALGFTNNPTAIPLVTRIAVAPSLLNPHANVLTSDYLEKKAQDAAIASVGTLHANALLPMLKNVFADRELGWRTRCLAAKSIGDLGTKEALDYLDAQLKSGTISAASDRGGFLAQVIELYR